jgi:hypothetical protein
MAKKQFTMTMDSDILAIIDKEAEKSKRTRSNYIEWLCSGSLIKEAAKELKSIRK